MASLQGHLLVAAQHLAEPFFRSVILMVRHNDEGALGLILNRRTGTPVAEVWKKVSELPCHSSESLYLGGPCDGPLMALHREEFLMDLEVMPGLYFSGSSEKLERLVLHEENTIRFFVGYAGWGPGQLEGEIKRGSWQTMAASVEHVFGDHDDLWKKTTRAIADRALCDVLHIKKVPDDPRLN